MTAADLAPIIQILMSEYNVLILALICILLITVFSFVRLVIVIYRSVKGRMNRV